MRAAPSPVFFLDFFFFLSKRKGEKTKKSGDVGAKRCFTAILRVRLVVYTVVVHVFAYINVSLSLSFSFFFFFYCCCSCMCVCVCVCACVCVHALHGGVSRRFTKGKMKQLDEGKGVYFFLVFSFFYVCVFVCVRRSHVNTM